MQKKMVMMPSTGMRPSMVGRFLVLSEDVGTSPARTDLASRSWVMAIRRMIKGMMKSPSSCQRYFFIVLSGVRFAICIPFIGPV